jgi:hypothetical protein
MSIVKSLQPVGHDPLLVIRSAICNAQLLTKDRKRRRQSMRMLKWGYHGASCRHTE